MRKDDDAFLARLNEQAKTDEYRESFKQAAGYLRMHYENLLAAGFDDKQAIFLVAQFQQVLFARPSEKRE